LTPCTRRYAGASKGRTAIRTGAFIRVDLHDGLFKLGTDPDLSKGHPRKILLATEVAGVDCEKGELTTANGETIRKDLVVVADGVHVRERTCSFVP
jgi:2-polyprenyl-6-methoxyphenol hydroxylase-like FAD-dependent oxidoreductase